MRFKDKEEALRRLEAELLREEEEAWEEESWEEEEYEEEYEEGEDWEEEAAAEDPEETDWDESEGSPAAYRVPYRAYNTDHVDGDLDAYGEEVYSAGKRSRGRWIAAGALIVLAAVLLVLAFLFARYGGA